MIPSQTIWYCHSFHTSTISLWWVPINRKWIISVLYSTSERVFASLWPPLETSSRSIHRANHPGVQIQWMCFHLAPTLQYIIYCTERDASNLSVQFLVESFLFWVVTAQVWIWDLAYRWEFCYSHTRAKVSHTSPPPPETSAGLSLRAMKAQYM